VSGTTVDTVDVCLVEGNLSVKDAGAGEFLGVQRIFGQTMLRVPQHSYNMMHTSFRRTSARCDVPCWLQQLGCEWNAKLQNWGRCSKVLSQLGFGNVLAQSSVLFLSYQKPNFKCQIFCLQASGNLVEDNIIYQHLKSICRGKVRRIKVFRRNLGKYGQNTFAPQKIASSYTRNISVFFGGSKCTNRAILNTELSFAKINIKGCFHANWNMSHVSTLQ